MDVEASYSDFINCDRTGRRNAVPDITREGEQVPASTSELAKDMAEMDLKAAGKFRLIRRKCKISFKLTILAFLPCKKGVNICDKKVILGNS